MRLVFSECVAMVLLGAVVCFIGNQANAQQRNTKLDVNRPVAAYTLGSGDQIRVTVFGHTDLSGEFEIDGIGRVSLPLIQDVKAAGLSLKELEKSVTRKLKPDFLKNPRVSIDVLNYRPFYILGEVKKPGSYPFVNGMTVVNAIALAGGYTYRAGKDDIFIVRAGDVEQKKQGVTHETIVMPGDVIEVPDRFF